MPIHLKKVSKYLNKLIKTKKGYDFPAYNLTGENSFYFALLCGVRGAGKTNAMLQILNIEKEHLLSGDNIVYWVSPTHDSKVAEFAEKFPDNMVFVDELNIKTFNNIREDIQDKIDEWKQTKFIFDLFEQYLKKQDSIDEEELNILFESGMLDDDTDVKELIKNFNFHHPPRASLVCDDSMGSPLISSSNSKQGKEFTRWAIRHRHDFTNIFILSQYYRGISKNLRNNTNMVMLFPSKDRGTASSIFDEFSNVFGGKKENYEQALDLLDKESVGSFLLIYYDKKKFLRLGFDKQIDFTD
jgi:hypothetical protein